MPLLLPAQIDALEAAGACAASVADARARWRAVQPVYDPFERAFAGVVLGDGIGLWQAQAIDDYEDDATCARQRERDEKLDWRRIPVASLNRCYSSLSFFDAAGMRFHLPAFVLADLRGEFNNDLVFTLTLESDYNLARFALFDTPQRDAVRGYLRHVAEHDPNGFDRAAIEPALAGYWAR